MTDKHLKERKMPCYEINLISIEFKAASKDNLLVTLKNLALYPQERNGMIYFGYQGENIDLSSGTIQAANTTTANLIKREYSKVTICSIAKKKKWIFKKISENKLQLRRY
jgi:hypothetical protein